MKNLLKIGSEVRRFVYLDTPQGVESLTDPQRKGILNSSKKSQESLAALVAASNYDDDIDPGQKTKIESMKVSALIDAEGNFLDSAKSTIFGPVESIDFNDTYNGDDFDNFLGTDKGKLFLSTLHSIKTHIGDDATLSSAITKLSAKSTPKKAVKSEKKENENEERNSRAASLDKRYEGLSFDEKSGKFSIKGSKEKVERDKLVDMPATVFDDFLKKHKIGEYTPKNVVKAAVAPEPVKKAVITTPKSSVDLSGGTARNKSEANKDLQKALQSAGMNTGRIDGDLGKNNGKSKTRKAIQTLLQNKGFYNGSIDGKIGKQSKAAIKAAQKALNITVDGNMSVDLINKLNTYTESELAAAVTSGTISLESVEIPEDLKVALDFYFEGENASPETAMALAKKFTDLFKNPRGRATNSQAIARYMMGKKDIDMSEGKLLQGAISKAGGWNKSRAKVALRKIKSSANKYNRAFLKNIGAEDLLNKPKQLQSEMKGKPDLKISATRDGGSTVIINGITYTFSKAFIHQGHAGRKNHSFTTWSSKHLNGTLTNGVFKDGMIYALNSDCNGNMVIIPVNPSEGEKPKVPGTGGVERKPGDSILPVVPGSPEARKPVKQEKKENTPWISPSAETIKDFRATERIGKDITDKEITDATKEVYIKGKKDGLWSLPVDTYGKKPGQSSGTQIFTPAFKAKLKERLNLITKQKQAEALAKSKGLKEANETAKRLFLKDLKAKSGITIEDDGTITVTKTKDGTSSIRTFKKRAYETAKGREKVLKEINKFLKDEPKPKPKSKSKVDVKKKETEKLSIKAETLAKGASMEINIGDKNFQLKNNTGFSIEDISINGDEINLNINDGGSWYSNDTDIAIKIVVNTDGTKKLILRKTDIGSTNGVQWGKDYHLTPDGDNFILSKVKKPAVKVTAKLGLVKNSAESVEKNSVKKFLGEIKKMQGVTVGRDGTITVIKFKNGSADSKIIQESEYNTAAKRKNVLADIKLFLKGEPPKEAENVSETELARKVKKVRDRLNIFKRDYRITETAGTYSFNGTDGKEQTITIDNSKGIVTVGGNEKKEYDLSKGITTNAILTKIRGLLTPKTEQEKADDMVEKAKAAISKNPGLRELIKDGDIKKAKPRSKGGFSIKLKPSGTILLNQDGSIDNSTQTSILKFLGKKAKAEGKTDNFEINLNFKKHGGEKVYKLNGNKFELKK